MDRIQPAEIQNLSFTFLNTPSNTQTVLYQHDVSGSITSSFDCEACCKKFTTKGSLKRHHERFPLCVQWITDHSASIQPVTPNPQVTPLDILVEKFVCQSYFDSAFICRYCKESFANRGNCNRHFSTSVVCSRLALEHFHTLWIKQFN